MTPNPDGSRSVVAASRKSQSRACGPWPLPKWCEFSPSEPTRLPSCPPQAERSDPGERPREVRRAQLYIASAMSVLRVRKPSVSRPSNGLRSVRPGIVGMMPKAALTIDCFASKLPLCRTHRARARNTNHNRTRRHAGREPSSIEQRCERHRGHGASRTKGEYAIAHRSGGERSPHQTLCKPRPVEALSSSGTSTLGIMPTRSLGKDFGRGGALASDRTQ